MSIAISIDIIRHISQKQLKQSAEKVTFYKNLKGASSTQKCKPSA